MTIKRFDNLDDDGDSCSWCEMPYKSDGEFVYYTDHLDAINQAKIDAVREFAEWCKKGGATPFSDDAKYMTGAFIFEQLKEQSND